MINNNRTPLQEALDKASISRRGSGHGESEPVIEITWGTEKEAELILKAAQAYADLPNKIEGIIR